MTVQAMTTSPCVKICRLGEDGVCVGCWRTLVEIAQWAGMDESERQRLVSEVLPARRRDREQESCGSEP